MQNKPGVPSSFGNVVKLEFLITVKLKGFLHWPLLSKNVNKLSRIFC